MTKELPSPDLLRKLLRYDYETGKFFWLYRSSDMFATERAFKTWNTQWAGSEAFLSIDSHGYNCARILGKRFRAHRVAWAMHYGSWPTGDIDHINGDRTSNKIKNLREVFGGENQRNAKIPSNNKSGFCGVRWCHNRGKWRASIRVNGKEKSLGSFAKIEDAVAVRESAKVSYGYSSRHGLI